MIKASDIFKRNITEFGKEIAVRISYEDIVIINQKIKSTVLTKKDGLFKSSMRAVDIVLDGEIDLRDKELFIDFGVKYGKNEYEYIHFGTFIPYADTINFDYEKKQTSFTCYDKLIKTHIPYNLNLNISNNGIVVDTLINAICSYFSFDFLDQDYVNKNAFITVDNYNLMLSLNPTFRDVLDYLAQITASLIIIEDNELKLIYPSKTEYVFDGSNLKTLKVSDRLGPINRISFAKTVTENNQDTEVTYYREDIDSINANGKSEIIINNNPLLNDEMLTDIFEQIGGFIYYNYDISSFGFCYFNPLEIVTIRYAGNEYTSIITNDIITIHNGLAESLYSEKESSYADEYTSTSSSEKSVNFDNAVYKEIYSKIFKGISAEFQEVNTDILNVNKELIALKGNVESLDVGTLTADMVEVKGRLTAAEAEINSVKSDYVKTSTLEAEKATINRLIASKASISDLNAVQAEVNTLKVNSATVEQLNATNAKVNTLTTDVANINKAIIDVAHISDLNAINGDITLLQTEVANINTLVGEKASIKDLETTNAKVTNISGDLASYKTTVTEKLEAYDADIINLNSKNADIEKALIDKADIKDLTAVRGKVDELESNTIKADELEAEVAEFGYLKTTTANATYATIENLNSASASINSLNSKLADIEKAKIELADVETLLAEKAYVNKAEFNSLIVEKGILNEAEINTLILEKGYAEKLYVDTNYAKKQYVDENYVGVQYAQETYATLAQFGTLNTAVANINTLLSGSVSAGSTQTIVLNADNTTIANALIKDAMIDSLSFSKISGIDINTTNLNIHSNDGKSTWKDNTIQIKDATRTRVQIGKDSEGDYNIYIWDKNGNLMFDPLGLTDKGVTREVIDNSNVKANANIHGSKLDIDSVIEEVNGSTKTIKSSKIYFDEDKQTLDVLFNKLDTTVASQTTTINTLQSDVENATKIANTANTNAIGALTKGNTAISNAQTAQNTADSALAKANTVDKTVTELSKTVETNTTSISVANGNISSLITRVTQTEKDITTVEGDVSTAKTNISNLTTQYNSVKSTVDSHTQTIASHTTSITELQDTDGTLQESITEVDDRVASVETNLDGFKTSVSNTYATKSSLNNYATTSAINSAISQKATEITTSVSNTYATKQSLSNVETRMSSAEQKITSDAIVSTVRAHANYKSDLSGKVGINEIISRINQTAESITIDASKINLNGYLTISGASSTYATKSALDTTNKNVTSAQSTANTASTNASSALTKANTANSVLSNWGYNGGTTTINGAKIQTGTITADKINVKDLFAQDITATGSITGLKYLSSGADVGGYPSDMVLDAGSISLVAIHDEIYKFTSFISGHHAYFSYEVTNPVAGEMLNFVTINGNHVMLQSRVGNSSAPVKDIFIASTVDGVKFAGASVTDQLIFNTGTVQSATKGIKWQAINSRNPYIGYATDQTDGTFVVGSLLGTNYASGLAIGGGSGNLLWKGAKVATVNDNVASATSATKLASSVTLKVGNTGKSFNGSAGLTWTLEEIGASASNHSHSNYSLTTHTHSYLPLTGGTLTGDLLAPKNFANFGSLYTEELNVGTEIIAGYGAFTDLDVDKFTAMNGGAFIGKGLEVSDGLTVSGEITLNSNLSGKYLTGTWLQATASNHLTSAGTKFVVQDASGWLYHRTASEVRSDIGAAASSHTHSYLPLSGGTVTGALTVNGAITGQDVIKAAGSNNVLGCTRFTQEWIGFYSSHANANANTSRRGYIGQDGTFTNIINEVPISTANSNGGMIKLVCPGVQIVFQNKYGMAYFENGLRPSSSYDNQFTLGQSGSRWKQLFAGTTTISTSDRNKKKDFTDFDERYERLFMDLKPQLFKFKDGESNRYHSGFISQDIELSLLDNGMTAYDFAGFCKDKAYNCIVDNEGVEIPTEKLDRYGNQVYDYSLRYEEFIALNTHMIQKNVRCINAIENQITYVNDELSQVKNELRLANKKIASLEAQLNAFVNGNYTMREVA